LSHNLGITTGGGFCRDDKPIKPLQENIQIIGKVNGMKKLFSDVGA
jgi:hypothetical protein